MEWETGIPEGEGGLTLGWEEEGGGRREEGPRDSNAREWPASLPLR